MNKLLYLMPILALSVMAFHNPVTYRVDLSSSVIVWKGYKVTGEHTGTVKLKSGELQFTNGRLSGGSFEADMTTINCTDLEGATAEKLVNHLKSDDFFGVQKYPIARFVITKAFPTDTKGNYRITGNLTIKETTKEVKFNALVTESGNQIKASGKLTIDRADFNVRYGSGSFFDNLGDKTIYDEFDLNVTVVAKK
ncbi:MAG: YceI family protein [Saprospiraceae bacterium]|nr:YceI family protein [Saprospiraceae bacterium]MDW8482889.1 YceI family protein [Saprospiraceae bacterium]